jgi:hypothetical protein
MVCVVPTPVDTEVTVTSTVEVCQPGGAEVINVVDGLIGTPMCGEELFDSDANGVVSVRDEKTEVGTAGDVADDVTVDDGGCVENDNVDDEEGGPDDGEDVAVELEMTW